MEKLLKALRAKVYATPFIALLFLAAALYSTNTQVIIIFTVITAIILLQTIYMYLQYQSLQPGLPSEQTALSQMRQVYTTVKHVQQVEDNIRLFFLPVILIAASIFGGTLGGRLDIWEMLQKPPIIIVMLINLVVFPPIVHWLSNKANYLTFGQYLEKLEENIKLLEKPV
ncbi:MAG: hypothetical protein V4714_20655 [Bacteroidota bacterium]